MKVAALDEEVLDSEALIEMNDIGSVVEQTESVGGEGKIRGGEVLPIVMRGSLLAYVTMCTGLMKYGFLEWRTTSESSIISRFSLMTFLIVGVVGRGMQ